MKEINNRQEGVEFDLYTLTGRYYEKPCCGWRNQVGRSQPGDWHISVGDEVKASFKLLRVKTHTRRHTNIWHLHRRIQTRARTLYTVNRNKDEYLDRHTHTPTERGAHSC